MSSIRSTVNIISGTAVTFLWFSYLSFERP